MEDESDGWERVVTGLGCVWMESMVEMGERRACRAGAERQATRQQATTGDDWRRLATTWRRLATIGERCSAHTYIVFGQPTRFDWVRVARICISLGGLQDMDGFQRCNSNAVQSVHQSVHCSIDGCRGHVRIDGFKIKMLVGQGRIFPSAI